MKLKIRYILVSFLVSFLQKRPTLIVFGLFFTQTLFAQNSVITDPAMSFVDSVYAEGLVTNQYLNHGRLYTFFKTHMQGHQYLIGRNSEKGSVVYNGLTFNDVHINYDMYNDELLLNIVSGNGIHKVVSLDKSKISSFSYKDHDFIHIRDKEGEYDGSGFYQLAHKGKKSKLLIKKRKITQNINGTVTSAYVRKDTYFLSNSNGVKEIRGKKDLLTIFNNDPELKSLISKNKTKFNKNVMEDNLLALLDTYDN